MYGEEGRGELTERQGEETGLGGGGGGGAEVKEPVAGCDRDWSDGQRGRRWVWGAGGAGGCNSCPDKIVNLKLA